MRTLAITLLALSLIKLGASAQPTNSASALKFKWPVEKSFQVDATIEKKGNRVRARFTVLLSRTNQDFILRWLDARVQEVNGQKFGAAERSRPEMAQIESMLRYAPLHISADGEFLEAIDITKTMKELNKTLNGIDPQRPQEVSSSFERFSESESGRKIINRAYAEIWMAWVEQWIDLELLPGQKSTHEAMVPFEGAVIPAQATFSNLGSLKENPNLLHVKYEEIYKMSNASGALNQMIDRLAGEMQTKKSAEPLPEKISFERTTVVEAHTDRITLQPAWVKRSVVLTMTAPGINVPPRVESQEYRFYWKGDAPSK